MDFTCGNLYMNTACGQEVGRTYDYMLMLKLLQSIIQILVYGNGL